MAKKSPSLTGLVSTKGAVKPISDMPTRGATPIENSTPTADLEPLNFKVSPEFRKRFRTVALENDLKLNGLLFAALDAFENAQKGKA